MVDWEAERNALCDRLARQGRVDDERVLDALRAVPRHEFVPDTHRDEAYQDTPLPIGAGQTISAPHMVAVMCDLLELTPGADVLEIGTGCGYHAAVTAELVGAEHVSSVEYHDQLARRTRERLDRLGYGGISIRAGDGKEGWPDHAPFDRAYLTCAAPEFPAAVVEQVRNGGILLGPLKQGHRQTLVRAQTDGDGSLQREDHGGVRFVDLQ
ncbi:protein-L-isoaspartate(D-aspartate) O-methyltransferase [Haloarculaceae archaeon H-GB2-1]|nr:protein-L-isoaspartate(D-aspartate) O-methyltransferase [Haloarculaceae archaeon H-GB1-1]MEA5389097.1 protein-L-isoaspartate(D-aspartate) O-methyltransferase [Haloarculaceae archaeon H-GB11]MEA5407159.1 protein-L-isoaspartate(D-aspartate) O-methyltransferase [Haloarculaceae archaeon H-GB2-1]